MSQINENLAKPGLNKIEIYKSLKWTVVYWTTLKWSWTLIMKVRNTKKSQLMNLNMS
jgi:hypothetical protein